MKVCPICGRRHDLDPLPPVGGGQGRDCDEAGDGSFWFSAFVLGVLVLLAALAALALIGGAQ